MRNLTQIEIPCLKERYNLTDGHAFRPWTQSEQLIVSKVTEHFLQATRETQHLLETSYLEEFFALAKQTIDQQAMRCLLCSSASMALELLGNYLRLTKKSVALIEPCFDNLADIFKRHGIPLMPIPETLLDSDELFPYLDSIEIDAICIVTPNNPTGLAMNADSFVRLAQYCKANELFLIVDNAFRFYGNASNSFDQYEILSKAQVEFGVLMIDFNFHGFVGRL